jgi:hypothetical protein
VPKPTHHVHRGWHCSAFFIGHISGYVVIISFSFQASHWFDNIDGKLKVEIKDQIDLTVWLKNPSSVQRLAYFPLRIPGKACAQNWRQLAEQ